MSCRSCQGWHAFLPVPVSGQVALGHDEVARRYQIPIDGSEVTCHDEIVSVASKKRGTRASARQPKDAVPGNETVRVQPNFINGTEFSSIDVRVGYKAVLGWRKALN
jgi:hypothetical protein